jgi:hypothetical protein
MLLIKGVVRGGSWGFSGRQIVLKGTDYGKRTKFQEVQ